VELHISGRDRRPAHARGFALAEGKWWGGSTRRGSTVYLHILRWPADTIALPAIARRVLRQAVLIGGTASLRQTSAGIEAALPAAQRHPVHTIVRLEPDGPAPVAALRGSPLRPYGCSSGRPTRAARKLTWSTCSSMLLLILPMPLWPPLVS